MEWISVNDRIPINEEDVLCFNGYQPQFVAAYFHENEAWESFIDGGQKSLEVTHWMPLPPPPKGE